MKEKIVVDLNVITEYLKTGKGSLPAAYEKFEMQIVPTTHTALLASETFKDESIESEVSEFIGKYFSLANFDENSAKSASKVIRENNISLASAMMVGYAIANDMPLLSNSFDEYKSIEGLNEAEV